ncbi:hypothetical protein [Novosphingobium guangzhouense]|nr:hypothetical protein [Novosphingobium guangzhouense]
MATFQGRKNMKNKSSTTFRYGTATLALAMLATVTACSKEERERAPSEQEIHSMDNATRSAEVGRHPYRCSDGSKVYVDFKDAGLTLEYRTSKTTPPQVLTAPSQGLQFFGEHGTAIVRNQNLILEEAGVTRTCTRDGWE